MAAVIQVSMWLIVVTAVVLGGCGAPTTDETLSFRGEAMGTRWSVIVRLGPHHRNSRNEHSTTREERTTAGLKQEIVATIERVEQQMSHWRDDTPVSQFNRNQSVDPQRIPPELGAVIDEALRMYDLSDGAFDITAAPLVNLWGFGPRGSTSDGPSNDVPSNDVPSGKQPEDAQIVAALRQVGSDKLHLARAGDGAWTLAKQDPDIRIDLSALAKGYAIDLVAEQLRARRIQNYLIEVGGEVRAGGANEKGVPWQIGLEQPDPRSMGQVRATVGLQDRAIATSGSYRNFIQAKRGELPYSHLIDPRTGRPVAHNLVSVSVIESTTMRADAWATALMVLGPEVGFALASERNIAATFVSRSPMGFVEKSTRQFEATRSASPRKSPSNAQQ